MKNYKKILSCLFCLMLCFALTAQTIDEVLGEEPDYQKTEIIEEKGRLYTLTIEYFPSLDEARFIYKINSHLFDQGDAMFVIRERANLFVAQHSYYSYTYYRKDLLKYDNKNDLAVYTSFIKLKK